MLRAKGHDPEPPGHHGLLRPQHPGVHRGLTVVAVVITIRNTTTI